MDKRRFLEQIMVLQEELGRQGIRRFPRDVQQRCIEMLVVGLISGPELANVMKVGIQTIYSWKKKYGRNRFKVLRVVSSSRCEVMDSIYPKVVVNGLEFHLGTLTMGQLKSLLEGLR